MLLHKMHRFVLGPEHRRKLLQQFGFAVLPLAFDLFKAFLELLQFFTLFDLRSLPLLPVRAFRMRYGDPVASVIVDLCLEKVHLTPPVSSDMRFNSVEQHTLSSHFGKKEILALPIAVTSMSFVLFSCKFLSSEEKICTKKRA